MAQAKRTYLLIMIFCLSVFSGTIWAGQIREDSIIGGRKLYLLNLSAGNAALLQGNHDLRGALGMGLALFYVNGRQFFGARWAASTIFMRGGGYDFSLLYGRAWTGHRSLLTIASGIGYSRIDTYTYKNDSRIGLPVDIKALVISSKKRGVSAGIHGFAFFTSTYQYFGVCFNLGIFLSGR